MSGLSPQLSATFSTLQRLQREHQSLGEKLVAAESHLADVELQLSTELPSSTSSMAPDSDPTGRLRRELAQIKGSSGRVRLTEQPADVRRALSQMVQTERQMAEARENPLGDPSLSISPALGSLLAQIDQTEEEVRALRNKRDEIESRIAIFQAWAFEEIAEEMPASLAPAFRSLLNPDSPASETFKMLRTKIQTIGEERQFRCMGFVSASESEGSTTTALGLALSMAQEPGRRILLIEADLRKPTIDRYLGLPRRVGLGEWLQGSVGPVRLRRLEPHGLFLLSAGTPASQAAELLASGRMAQLLEVARQSFDYILVDCPPPFPLADTIILQELLDGFLFVVRARHTPRETIQASIAHLRPDCIHGVIFNDHREIIPRFYTHGHTAFSRRS